jgi:hypothetical protein
MTRRLFKLSAFHPFLTIIACFDHLTRFHLQDMQGHYIGQRPVRIKRSTWADKNKEVVEEKDRERAKRRALGLE